LSLESKTPCGVLVILQLDEISEGMGGCSAICEHAETKGGFDEGAAYQRKQRNMRRVAKPWKNESHGRSVIHERASESILNSIRDDICCDMFKFRRKRSRENIFVLQRSDRLSEF
jgi:hypothetical protein